MNSARKNRVFHVLISMILICICLTSLLPDDVLAHSGRTDSRGGHRDNKNASGLGSYHYHHGYPAHLHPNGVCPYEGPVEPVKPAVVPVSSVSINSSSDRLEVGESLSLNTNIYPSNATDKSVTWTSSNENVATVSSSGVVTAVSVGVVEISVSSQNGIKDSIILTVGRPIEEIAINEKDILMFVGDKMALSVYKYPSDADDMEIVWSSTDPSIVEVNSVGEITAKKAGIALIIAETANHKSDSTTVEVLELEEVIPTGSIPTAINTDDDIEDQINTKKMEIRNLIVLGIIIAVLLKIRNSKKR